MPVQNIYTIKDYQYCPEGKGEIIINYLKDLFDRCSLKIKPIESRIDWLIIESNDLLDASFSSQNFFEEIFDESLNKNLEGKLLTVHKHSIGSIGHNPKGRIEEWIKDRLESNNYSLNYINETTQNGFVGYRLNANNQS